MNIKVIKKYLFFLGIILSISRSLFSAAKIEQEISTADRADKLGLDLIYVIRFNYEKDKVVKLIADGANLNVLDEYHNSPLMYACSSNDTKNLEIVKILIENGANINQVGGSFNERVLYKWTPLVHAINSATEYSSRDVIELLIEMGADVNIQAGDGSTAIILLACFKCNLSRGENYDDIFELLLRAGSDLDKKTNDGSNVSNYIRSSSEFFVMLENEPKRRDNVLIQWNKIQAKKINGIVQKLILPLSELIAQYSTGQYNEIPLFYRLGLEKMLFKAVKNKDKKLVEKLLCIGADPNKVNEWNETPMYCAIYENDKDIVKSLLDYSAHIDSFNGNGDNRRTSLMAASDWGRKDIVRLLLDRGADLNKTAIKKYSGVVITALDLAQEDFYGDDIRKKNREQIAKMLLEEPSRRIEFIKKFNEDLERKIGEANLILTRKIVEIIAQYIAFEKYEETQNIINI